MSRGTPRKFKRRPRSVSAGGPRGGPAGLGTGAGTAAAAVSAGFWVCWARAPWAAHNAAARARGMNALVVFIWLAPVPVFEKVASARRPAHSPDRRLAFPRPRPLRPLRAPPQRRLRAPHLDPARGAASVV